MLLKYFSNKEWVKKLFLPYITGCVQFCWQFVIAIQQNELNDIKVYRADWYSKFSVKEIHRNIEHSNPVIFNDDFYVLIGVFIYTLEWTSSLWHCVRIRIRDGSINNSCGEIFPMKIPSLVKLWPKDAELKWDSMLCEMSIPMNILLMWKIIPQCII